MPQDSGAVELINPYLPERAALRKIVKETVAGDIKSFELVLADREKQDSFIYKPGQFAMISVFGAGECPIGFASSPTERGFLRFTVKKTGVVTAALHSCEERAVLGVRGPYGNGWPLNTMRKRNVLVVGGGFAFTTLRSLITYILDRGNRDHFRNLTTIYGARSPGDLIYKDDLQAWRSRDDIELHVTVDKGDAEWKGKEGYVPTILKEVAPSSENAVALVCGPPVMIKFTIPVLSSLGFDPEDTYLSLEMRMKCGIGKCGRCNVGDKYVCMDGPVFSLKDLRQLPQEY